MTTDVTEFNMKYMQENGLVNPIIIYEKTGLGMRSVHFNVVCTLAVKPVSVDSFLMQS